MLDAFGRCPVLDVQKHCNLYYLVSPDASSHVRTTFNSMKPFGKISTLISPAFFEMLQIINKSGQVTRTCLSFAFVTLDKLSQL